MRASDLLLQLRTSGAVVTLTRDGRVQIEAPAGLLDDALRSAIRDQRDTLVHLLRKTHTIEGRGRKLASLASFASGVPALCPDKRTQKTQNTHRDTPVPAADVSSPAGPPLNRSGGMPLRDWQDGVQRLADMPPPRGFSHRRWNHGVDWAQRLSGSAASLATDLGWSLEALFGLHPRAPSARYDAMGLAFLLRPGDCLLAITATEAMIGCKRGAKQRFTLGRMSRESVPAWQLSGVPPAGSSGQLDATSALITDAA
jgi:hypothetical protein